MTGKQRHAQSLPIHDLPAGGRRFGQWCFHRAGYALVEWTGGTFTLSSAARNERRGPVQGEFQLCILTGTRMLIGEPSIWFRHADGTGA